MTLFLGFPVGQFRRGNLYATIEKLNEKLNRNANVIGRKKGRELEWGECRKELQRIVITES